MWNWFFKTALAAAKLIPAGRYCFDSAYWSASKLLTKQATLTTTRRTRALTLSQLFFWYFGYSRIGPGAETSWISGHPPGLLSLWDRMKAQKRCKMVKATDENVSNDVSWFLEENPDVRGPNGERPSLVVVTYKNSTTGFVSAIFILSLIFTLGLFAAMALYNIGKWC